MSDTADLRKTLENLDNRSAGLTSHGNSGEAFQIPSHDTPAEVEPKTRTPAEAPEEDPAPKPKRRQSKREDADAKRIRFLNNLRKEGLEVDDWDTLENRLGDGWKQTQDNLNSIRNERDSLNARLAELEQQKSQLDADLKTERKYYKERWKADTDPAQDDQFNKHRAAAIDALKRAPATFETVDGDLRHVRMSSVIGDSEKSQLLEQVIGIYASDPNDEDWQKALNAASETIGYGSIDDLRDSNDGKFVLKQLDSVLRDAAGHAVAAQQRMAEVSKDGEKLAIERWNRRRSEFNRSLDAYLNAPESQIEALLEQNPNNPTALLLKEIRERDPDALKAITRDQVPLFSEALTAFSPEPAYPPMASEADMEAHRKRVDTIQQTSARMTELMMLGALAAEAVPGILNDLEKANKRADRKSRASAPVPSAPISQEVDDDEIDMDVLGDHLRALEDRTKAVLS